jgi:5-methylcytosine-specific restriction protein A
MARTEGHGNPNWTRDEVILALDLYLQSGDRALSKTDSRVVELSNLLRQMPYHQEAAKRTTFRNPDGVGFKLLNLRNAATGKGLGNISATDRAIWEEFGSRRDDVAKIAAAIRAGIGTPVVEDEGDEPEFLEGRLLTQMHCRRERSRKLRKLFFAEKSNTGFVCEMCDLSRSSLPLELQSALFEAHHIVPIAEAGERRTKLSDLALLCACCHRLIHKLICVKKRWISVNEARSAVLAGR